MEKSKNAGVWILVTTLILVVLGGICWWLKPWQYYYQWQDNQKAEKAGELAAQISAYYQKNNYFPWNFASKTYVPDAYLRRSEAAFVYLPAHIATAMEREKQNRDWWWTLLEIDEAEKEEINFWRENDEYYVLKQVSAGARVAVCFQPKSEKRQQQAARNCQEDGLGRRDAPYAVEDFDPCLRVDGEVAIGNLWCEVRN